MLSLDEARVAAGIPNADVWPGLTPDEREYRRQVLDRIARRVAEDGMRVSVPSPERGSQFMPFAALKGFEDVIAEVEEGAEGCSWRVSPHKRPGDAAGEIPGPNGPGIR